jgi:zinc and cadmium transporter
MINYLIVSSFLGSFGALLLASLLSFNFGDKSRNAIDFVLASIAIGTLITTAFAATLHQVIKGYTRPHSDLYVMVGAIVLIYLIEQLLPMRRVCQQKGCEIHPQLSGPKFFLGNMAYHIFMGVILAAGYIKSSSVGICTATAIFVYQIMHEKGVLDALLLQDVPKKKALIQNLLFNGLFVIVAISTYYILIALEMFIIDLILSASVGAFIYLSVSEMGPNVHEKRTPLQIILQFVIILSSILLMSQLVHLNSFYGEYTDSINWVDLG